MMNSLPLRCTNLHIRKSSILSPLLRCHLLLPQCKWSILCHPWLCHRQAILGLGGFHLKLICIQIGARIVTKSITIGAHARRESLKSLKFLFYWWIIFWVINTVLSVLILCYFWILYYIHLVLQYKHLILVWMILILCYCVMIFGWMASPQRSTHIRGRFFCACHTKIACLLVRFKRDRPFLPKLIFLFFFFLTSKTFQMASKDPEFFSKTLEA